MYHQNYNPTGSVVLSTLFAAVPILVLLYFIALHPHRDQRGIRRFGLAAPYAAFYGVLAAFLVSCLAFKMPLVPAVSAFVLGSLSGFLGIIWIVVAAMFLYTMTVITGKFEIVKESIVRISFDRRLQGLLIAFSFGAIIEGTSGFRTPAAMQYFASGTSQLHLMTDVVAGVFSIVCTALFLRYVWHPKSRFLLKSEMAAAGAPNGTVSGARPEPKYTAGQTIRAWIPWTILILCCALWGSPPFKKTLNESMKGATFETTVLGGKFSGSLSLPVWEMPRLHKQVQRTPPVVAPNAKPEAATFTINWLSAAGTGVFVAALLSALSLGLTAGQWKEAAARTARRMKIPVLVIV